MSFDPKESALEVVADLGVEQTRVQGSPQLADRFVGLIGGIPKSRFRVQPFGAGHEPDRCCGGKLVEAAEYCGAIWTRYRRLDVRWRP